MSWVRSLEPSLDFGAVVEGEPRDGCHFFEADLLESRQDLVYELFSIRSVRVFSAPLCGFSILDRDLGTAQLWFNALRDVGLIVSIATDMALALELAEQRQPKVIFIGSVCVNTFETLFFRN